MVAAALGLRTTVMTGLELSPRGLTCHSPEARSWKEEVNSEQ
ncbi:MAG: hypothetical protein R6U62_06215 [Bacteroidales bacterium]